MEVFEWGYLLGLLDQLSNLALNSLAVETWRLDISTGRLCSTSDLDIPFKLALFSFPKSI